MALVWLVVLVGVAWPVAFVLGLLWIVLQVRALVCRACHNLLSSCTYVLTYVDMALRYTFVAIRGRPRRLPALLDTLS
jgi:hypothetical protein